MSIDKNTFEYQVSILMLTAAGADSELSQQEVTSIVDSLNELFYVLGKNKNSIAYLEAVLEDIKAMSKKQMEERITKALLSMKMQLSKDQLEVVYKNMQTVAEVDGCVQAESDFLEAVSKAWF